MSTKYVFFGALRSTRTLPMWRWLSREGITPLKAACVRRIPSDSQGARGGSCGSRCLGASGSSGGRVEGVDGGDQLSRALLLDRPEGVGRLPERLQPGAYHRGGRSPEKETACWR